MVLNWYGLTIAHEDILRMDGPFVPWSNFPRIALSNSSILFLLLETLYVHLIPQASHILTIRISRPTLSRHSQVRKTPQTC